MVNWVQGKQKQQCKMSNDVRRENSNKRQKEHPWERFGMMASLNLLSFVGDEWLVGKHLNVPGRNRPGVDSSK